MKDVNILKNYGVDLNKSLELLGDMDMYNMTISDFMKEVEEKWNKIVEYKNSNNMPDYAIEVHSLKSDCKYLGFMTLAEVAYQHELKSKENDSEFVNTHFAELEDNYKKVLEIAKEYVQHNPVEE
jgi:HPt (histidine-containing phosphotransfer) domain-containing protein